MNFVTATDIARLTDQLVKAQERISQLEAENANLKSALNIDAAREAITKEPK